MVLRLATALGRQAPALLALFVAGACSRDGSSPRPSGPPVDIRGDWLVAERLSGGGVVCDDTIRLSIAQIGDSFTPTGYRYGICTARNGESMPVSSHLEVTDGRVDGSQLAFADSYCRYIGHKLESLDAVDGTVKCRFLVPGLSDREVSGAWSMRRADFVPPSVTIELDRAQLTHGDSVEVVVAGSDNLALQHVGAVFNYDRALHPDCLVNPAPERDSAAVTGASATRRFVSTVPPCMGSVVVTVFARDTARNWSEAQAERLPFVFPNTELVASLDDTIYTAGDTVRILIQARNARGLSSVGFWSGHSVRVGEMSRTVTGTLTTERFELSLPGDPVIAPHWVEPFARHALGWLTVMDKLRFRVTDATRLPVQRLSLDARPTDVAYDSATDRVYFVDSRTSAVHEVLLSTFAVGRVWPLPSPGVSLDLSVSGDSLVVALGGRLDLAVIRRNTGERTLVPIISPNTSNIFDVRRVRVVADGRAMLGVSSGDGGHIVELQLRDGTQRVRVPWYGYGTFERTPGRSRLLILDATSPVGAQLYLAGADTFLPHTTGFRPIPQRPPQGVGDEAARWLVGCTLLTPDIEVERRFEDPHIYPMGNFRPVVDQRAFCARRDGVIEFDAATGAALRHVWLPVIPDRLIPLPGRRILALEGTTAYMITLPE